MTDKRNCVFLNIGVTMSLHITRRIYIGVTPSLHITRGRNVIYPLGLMINNVPGTLFSLQSCHNYVSTPGDTVFCVITPSNSELSITFYFLGHTNHHKERLKVMSASKGVCSWCSTPYKYNCPWCPHHLKNLKIQGDVVQDLKQKLRDLQTEHQELEIEYFCLKREHQRLRQTLVELRALYHNQIDMIEMLKEKAIENIGKRLISFLFKQT